MEYFFTMLIPVIAVITIATVAKRIASKSFRCNNCGEQFSIKWTKVIVTEHFNDEYMLTCPHCKVKGWCIRQSAEN